MKNGIFRVIAALTLVLSLQSCVTNYVTANPAPLENGNKDNANIAQVQKKIEEDKQKLIASLQSEKAFKAKQATEIYRKEAIAASLALETTIDQILKEAEDYLGTPYRYGGMSRSGIDCSAFVLSVFGASTGLQLPRTAASQSQEGESISRSELKKGDLLFFSQGGGRISHVAIVHDVAADGTVSFIHSATSKGVSYSTLDSSYWGGKFRFAKRILTPDTLALIQQRNNPVQASL